MKKEYIMPTLEFFVIKKDDIIRTSDHTSMGEDGKLDNVKRDIF